MALEEGESDEWPLKKIKLRKSTFSCWECKRRKKRCIVSLSSSSGPCKSCERLGSPCVRQDCFEDGEGHASAVQERIDYVERLAVSLVNQKRRRQLALRRPPHSRREHQEARRQPPQACHGFLINPLTGAGEDRMSRCRSLAGYFCSVLPHPFIAEMMAKHGKAAFEGLREPLRLSKTSLVNADQSSTPLEIQPACLARKLIRLAVSLMYMDSISSERLADLQLGATAMATAARYVEAAQYLTSEQQLLESAAGLECVMMMGHYDIHLGQVRDAGTSFRKALHLVQRIKLLDRASVNDDEGKAAGVACFRLISASRSLSLHNGETCDDLDERSIRHEEQAKDQASQHLNRIHVRMWRRIIERNLRMKRVWGSHLEREAMLDLELDETLSIDQDMKRAMLSVPSSWWMLPNGHAEESNGTTEASFSCLNTSKDHYYTVVLAHLPYVLQVSTTASRSSYTYSTSAAVSASREVLLRFPIYQQYKHVPASYRAVEHEFFMAGVVLLLTHMHSHQSPYFDAIDHERPKDLNTLLGTIASMEKFFAQDRNNPGSECAVTLKRLMEAEKDMANGIAHGVTCFSGTPTFSNGLEHTDIFDIELPYFGTVRVERLNPVNGLQVASCHDSIAETFDLRRDYTLSSGRSTSFDSAYLDFELLIAHNSSIDATLANSWWSRPAAPIEVKEQRE